MVSFNLWNNARRTRQYPELKVGDEVRVTLNRYSRTKGYMPKWSTDVYKLLHIEDNDLEAARMPSDNEAQLSIRLMQRFMTTSGANMVEIMFWICQHPIPQRQIFT